MAAGRAVDSTRSDPGLTRPTDPRQPASTDSLSEDKLMVPSLHPFIHSFILGLVRKMQINQPDSLPLFLSVDDPG